MRRKGCVYGHTLLVVELGLCVRVCVCVCVCVCVHVHECLISCTAHPSSLALLEIPSFHSLLALQVLPSYHSHRGNPYDLEETATVAF